jgi:hypothetical protein
MATSSPGVCSASPHPPLHHLHAQTRRWQIHHRKADVPRGHAHLVIRPGMTIQHKGNAAGIKRCIGKIPPPCARHRHIRVRHRSWAKVRQIPTDTARHHECARARWQRRTAIEHRWRIFRQAVKAQRFQFNLPVKADDEPGGG